MTPRARARAEPALRATRPPPPFGRGARYRANGRCSDNRRRRSPGSDCAAGRLPSSRPLVGPGPRRPRPRSSSGPDPHRLNVDELFDPIGTELAAVAAALDAAEGQAWIGSDHAIDEHTAGLDAPSQLL